MKKAMIIFNPTSGKEKAPEYVEKIKEVLAPTYDDISEKETAKEGDAKKFARQALTEEADLVISLGGDGTVNEIVNGLALGEKRPKVAIIPLGTVNALAKALSIPLDPEEAIAFLPKADLHEIDVASANDHFFINSFSLGQLPSAVHQVSSDEKSFLGPLAYVKEGAKEIFKNDRFHLSMTSDETFEWEGACAVVMIGLTNYMAGMTNFFDGAEPGDGVLRGLIFQDLSLNKTVKMLPDFLKHQIGDNEEVFTFEAHHLTIDSDQPMTSNIDGDEGVSLPVTIQIYPKHLSVLVPS